MYIPGPRQIEVGIVVAPPTPTPCRHHHIPPTLCRKGWKGIHIELHICRSRNGRISRRRFRTLLVLKEGVDSGKGEEYSISYSSNSSSSSSSSSSNSSKRARQQGKEYLSCKSHTLRRSSKLGSCDEPPLNDGRARVRLVREERSNHGDTR